MALENTTIQEKLSEKFGDKVSNFRMERDMFVFDMLPSVNEEVIAFLKGDEVLRFNFLTDLCAIHYPDAEKERQFVVVYHLHNWIDNVRIRIKTYLNGSKPEIATITTVFNTANWMERETFDFYGIVFKGHPNLRKILNDENMVSFPLRKEYALEDSQRTDKDDRFFGRDTNNNQYVK